MPAPTNSPVVTSVPLSGLQFLLGEVTNQYQPTRVSSWQVVIPTSALGNEAVAGFAAFTVDGVTVTRGSTVTVTPEFFVGFFADYSFWEGNVGSNPYTETMGGQFLAPVCGMGSIYVYNSTAISPAIASGLLVVTSITTGTTPAGILVGSVIQGATPAGATVCDISNQCFVRFAQPTVGAGVLVEMVQK